MLKGMNYNCKDDDGEPLMVIFASAHFVWISRVTSDVVPSSRDTLLLLAALDDESFSNCDRLSMVNTM